MMRWTRIGANCSQTERTKAIGIGGILVTCAVLDLSCRCAVMRVRRADSCCHAGPGGPRLACQPRRDRSPCKAAASMQPRNIKPLSHSWTLANLLILCALQGARRRCAKLGATSVAVFLPLARHSLAGS